MALTLPTVGGSTGAWGTLLNTDLSDLDTRRYLGTAKLIAASGASSAVQNAADYVCTGTNDHTTLNTAIAALPSAGGRIILTDGTFNLGGTVTVDRDLMLTGNGWTTKLVLANGVNADAIAFSPGAGGIHAHFAEFHLDHNGANQTAGCGINASGAVQSVFDHLHIEHPYDAGIWLYQIGAGNLGHHNRVTRCLFDNGSVSAGNGQGVRMQSNDENYIAFCDFETMGGAGSEPYCVKDWSGTNIALGNVFVNGQEGWRQQDSSHSILIANTFDGQGRDCVHVSGGALSIFSNTFNGGGQTSAGAYGHVVLDNGGNCVVQGNIFTSPGTNGQLRDFIQIYASADHNLILGNQFNVSGTLYNSLIDDAAAHTIYAHNQGYLTENGGVSTTTPGAVSTVSIAHGLARTPTRYAAQAAGVNARSAPAFHLTADGTNVTLNFASNLTAAASYAWTWSASV